MKAKFGAIVVDGRGKIGGHVASKNRYGSYFRTKVTPVNPQTTLQQNVRASLSQLSKAWASLTDAQRALWASAAASLSMMNIFGDKITLTGFGMYIQVNRNLTTIGQVPISAPVAPSDVNSIEGLEIAADASAHTLALDGSFKLATGNTYAVVEMTPQMSPGRNFVKSEFRKLTTIVDSTALPVALGTLYEAKFGTLVEGQKIFVRLKFIETASGLSTIPWEASTIVVA